MFPLLVLMGAALAACAPPSDSAFLPVNLPATYASLPAAPDNTPLALGVPVKLDPRQQEAVVVGVMKWMKDPRSATFGDISAAKNPNGSITACGQVNGRNSMGSPAGMTPYIGVLVRRPMALEFVTVEIGALRPQRADVETLCHESGVAGAL
jgi:hypothetical protein